MQEGLTAEMIGARIVAVAHMAAAMHLALLNAEELDSSLPTAQQAMIGGTDRRVTDDPLSAVAG